MKYPKTARFYLDNNFELAGEGEFICELPDIQSIQLELKNPRLKNLKAGEKFVIPAEEIVEFA